MSLEELLDILRNGNLSEIDTSEAAFEVESSINQIKELHAAYYKAAQKIDELLNDATNRTTQFAAMSAQIKDGGPAFPCEQHETQDGLWNQTFESGMTLRDYFAAKAVPAVYKDYWEGVRLHEFSCDDETWPMSLALDAYRLADAMLRAREVQS